MKGRRVQGIAIKAGDTFRLVGMPQDDDGSPLLVSGLVITACVRASDGTLVEALTVSTGDIPSEFRLTSADTSGWPRGSLLCDVRVVQQGYQQNSNTFAIRVEEPVTS